MLIEAALRSRLLGAYAVTQLVGSGADARIFPVQLPQGVGYPAIAYQGISRVPDRTMDGPSGLVFRRIQYDCWSPNYGEASALSREVRRVLDGLTEIVEGIVVQGVEIEGPRDLYFELVKLYQCSLDAGVWFDERTES